MLYLVATPIGNMEDITLRALRVLKQADFILAEDTRKTGTLLKRHGITRKLVSYHEHNEERKRPWVLEKLKEGGAIALVTSAGTPTIADPGYTLVRSCRQENIGVGALPGPCAAVNALAMTSMPHHRFSFYGFLPKKKNQRQKILQDAADREGASVYYESPYRLTKTLSQLAEVLPQRKIAVVREMTKKFEEVREGSAQELKTHFTRHPPKGEIVLVVGSVQKRRALRKGGGRRQARKP
ncbi:MAG: 16S rRNA (cytidine(1402)-2'-O)-methyltransferase [Candidatus Omnitrophica bacterium]|nr:16S rRNA (cytidine(1402)-2'-O)-methyltransferase [Candidatus Omnitrophota bacterium]